MKKLIIGILISCFFSIAATCGENSSSARNVSARNVSAIGDERLVNAVPEPSSLLLGATGALLIGLAIRRSRR